MHRNAVFVDAGYIFAQGSISLNGSKLNRSDLRLDEAEIVRQLKLLALHVGAEAQLLRVYWYDGAKSGMTVDQVALADMEDVKVRLGSINSAGQQKGVDSLLVTDLIDLARNQAISDAVVVTGDGDLRIAVQIAQSFGVRVHLVTLEPSGVSLSPLLRQEADTVHEISKTDVAKFLRILASPTQIPKFFPPQSGIALAAVTLNLVEAINRSIELVLLPLSTDEVATLKAAVASVNSIPSQYDGRVLGTCRGLLGRNLTGDERREMREAFLKYLLSTPKS